MAAQVHTLSIDVNGCARCHGDGHQLLTFTALTHPLEIGGETLTHWAPCPTNGEPILLLFRQPVPEED